MRVAEVKSLICDAYRTNWVFAKVTTDSGLYGVGEATLEHNELAVAKSIEEVGSSLIGKDPHAVESFWQQAYRNCYFQGGPVITSALAALEMALWDIKGKDLGVPVFQLLGGKVRDSIPCYANAWFSPAKTPDEFAAKAEKAVGLGYTGLKWDPFGSAWQTLDEAQLNKALVCVAAVRAAVGADVMLLIEGHGRFDVPTAIRIGRKLEEYDIHWFEEPLPPNNFDGLVQVRQSIKVAVAAGERIYSRHQFHTFLTLGAADYAQPDVSHVGLGELRKMAAMAEACHLPICPHNPSGPVANAATLQVAACTPNFYLLETMATDVPNRKHIASENLYFENGCMSIPDVPGLGVDIDESEIAKYPYQPHPIRHYTGELTNIRPENEEIYYSLKS